MEKTVNRKIILSVVASANEHNMTMTEIANRLGIDMNEVREWINLKKEPSKEMVNLIEEFINNPEEVEARLKAKNKSEQTTKPTSKTTEASDKGKEPFMPEPEPEKELKQEPVKKTKAAETTKTTKTSKKEEPVMPTKEKKSTNKPANKQRNEEKKFFRESTEALIRNEINAKKTDVLTTNSVSLAGKNLADRIMKSVSDLLSIAQDTTQEAFREPDPLPEKIQKLLDAAEAASDEGIEMATTILKKFTK